MTRDQFLTEWLGECWHEWELQIEDAGPYAKFGEWLYKCSKCEAHSNENMSDRMVVRPSFSTWPGFGKLWEAAQKDEDEWDKFVRWYWKEQWDITSGWIGISQTMVHPDRFADAWAKFKGWKE